MQAIEKWTLCAVLGASLLAVGCTSIVKKIEQAFAIQPNYYTQTQTNYPIERQYTGMGKYAVQSQVFPSDDARFKTYKVWYPADIAQSTKPFPVIVSANGSGFAYQKYEPVLARLASWGFVVIGNDDGTSWSGLSSSQSLAKLDELNADKNSIFYKKLDTHNAGITGHSQGGVGAINGATEFANSRQFKSVHTASTTKLPLAQQLKWDYHVNKISVPYFATAGMGGVDAGNGDDKKSGITPLSSMQENAKQINSQKLNVMARRKDADHGQMLYIGDGYMTAWFLYTLLNDANAGKAFVGVNPEIQQNGLWQDVQIKP
ncbi:hypothetical protein NKT77_08615 [Moraxella sp. FZLJ2107]|uniref:poly(ethylene terephthalate) hydrolase family protein n=1 Tax=unclassified Moraxella TaxID=2685852 RepID=UPI0020C902A1|nr:MULTISPECIES: hypothetical protein [unclassified Moraxella]UTO04566.1 hypothetical protein NKT77_08615 [Moraxella sp. FZLJ2107]UTO23399.1 hypothetical protein NKU06_05400 [Moraxella sp. FZLJ2109]